MPFLYIISKSLVEIERTHGTVMFFIGTVLGVLAIWVSRLDLSPFLSVLCAGRILTIKCNITTKENHIYKNGETRQYHNKQVIRIHSISQQNQIV